MEKIRFGIIGLGNMGGGHLGYFGQLAHGALTALCDTNAERRAKYEKLYPDVAMFASHKELLASGKVDAILIAVPHYDHMPIAIDAFEKNIHVLCEKPLAVSVKAGREGIAAYEAARKIHPKLKFGIMFQARTNPMYQKLRDLFLAGELGEISRVTWIVTNWFRTWTYYASGGWRATWKGEGGGVLINQCPHNLDMIQYAFGNLMPTRVTAVATVGKTHPIEVEDDVSAILEYPNGAIGHFITTTGEAPGTNRLEVAGDRGKIIAEDNKLTFHRTLKNVQDVNRTSPESFAGVETWRCEIPFTPGPESHKIVTENFIAAIQSNLANEKLLAPGPEGIRGLELGNAIMMAGLTRTPVELPVDGAKYDAFIDDMAKKYGGKKTLTTKTAETNLAASFQKA